MEKWLAAWALMLLLPAAGSIAADQQVPGQKPLVLIADSFQFVAGSWARYDILDKEKNESYIMTFSILDRVQNKGRACSWLEIEIISQEAPRVVTRILVEETKQGPGDVDKAIVQVEGYSPFSVPKKFLKPNKEEQVAQFKPAKIVKRLERIMVGPKGRQIEAWRVEAVNSDNEEIKATVSIQLPPIAVYEAESPQMKMTATDWGLGAKSLVVGEPIPFWLWLTEAIGKGMEKK